MQIKIYILFLLLLPVFALCGTDPAGLFPEMEKAVVVKGRVRLPHWRFGDWGKRPAKGKSSGRLSSVAAVDGKVQITLENRTGNEAANMFFRTLQLKEKKAKQYRLKAVMVNSAPGKALVRFQLTASGGKYAFQKRFFTVSGTPAEREMVFTAPEKTSRLQISVTLYGPGKVTFSGIQLTGSDLPEVPFQPVLSRKTVTLPEKIPVTLPVSFPPGFTLAKDEALLLTLPWGIRLISLSRGVMIDRVSVKVRENTSYRLVCRERQKFSKVRLLLGCDLPLSEVPQPGSLQLEKKKEISEPVFFSFKRVRDLQALPPKFFRIGFPVSNLFSPHESVAAYDGALLRSGANMLFSAALNIPFRQLRTARIRQRVFLFLPAVRAEQHCYYSMIRNETFWSKHFIPSLHRNILRFGSRNVEALVCDSYLGQHRAVNCLCALCRNELRDFAPRLPQRELKYSSAGLLAARFPAELKKFRDARLSTLWAGARLHLPVDSRGFRRRPALIPIYTLREAFSRKRSIRHAESVIELHGGPELPDGMKHDPAVNFAASSAVCRAFRRNGSGSTALTARYTPPDELSQQELQFELLNLFFSGFSGVWVNLSPGCDYQQRKALAQTALLLREYETFFRRAPLKKHNWRIKTAAAPLELPPVPGPVGYPMALPRTMAACKLLIWKNGSRGIAAIGNFSPEPLQCTLSCTGLPPKAKALTGSGSFSAALLSTTGAVLTLPPRSWTFAELSGL